MVTFYENHVNSCTSFYSPHEFNHFMKHMLVEILNLLNSKDNIKLVSILLKIQAI